MSKSGTKRGSQIYTSVVMDEATNRLLRELAGARFDGNLSMTMRAAIRSLASQATVTAAQQPGGGAS